MFFFFHNGDSFDGCTGSWWDLQECFCDCNDGLTLDDFGIFKLALHDSNNVLTMYRKL